MGRRTRGEAPKARLVPRVRFDGIKCSGGAALAAPPSAVERVSKGDARRSACPTFLARRSTANGSADAGGAPLFRRCNDERVTGGWDVRNL